MFARFDSSQTQRQINALYYVLTLFPPIARLLLRKLFGLLSFSSALAVCLSTLSKPNLIHRIESHCKNNNISSKQARFAWIFCQYCQILIFVLLYIKVNKRDIAI